MVWQVLKGHQVHQDVQGHLVFLEFQVRSLFLLKLFLITFLKGAKGDMGAPGPKGNQGTQGTRYFLKLFRFKL